MTTMRRRRSSSSSRRSHCWRQTVTEAQERSSYQNPLRFMIYNTTSITLMWSYDIARFSIWPLSFQRGPSFSLGRCLSTARRPRPIRVLFIYFIFFLKIPQANPVFVVSMRQNGVVKKPGRYGNSVNVTKATKRWWNWAKISANVEASHCSSSLCWVSNK